MNTKLLSTLVAGFAVLILLFGCGKKKDVITPVVPPITLQAAATIDAGTVQQTIQGFGGASILAWIADLTSDQRTKAFSTTSGIGLSILRVMVPDNVTKFTAEKPTIDAAKSFGVKVIATAWTAPPSMMINLSLDVNQYAAYAAHLKSYNTAVGGVYAISPWNEPNYSASGWMKGSATEVANFVAAQGANCGAPIMAPEPFNMDQDFINTYLSNASAKTNTGFVCGHIYGKTPYALSVGKEVWMTEHYTNSSISGDDWSNAMDAAKEIHDCMNVGYVAYVWWYIRRSYGPIDENSNITKLGYVMAQFSRYIRPGYTKVLCTANPISGVYITAYKSGSSLVVVAINKNSDITNLTTSYSGITVSGFNGYTTTASSNLSPSNIVAAGGSFGVNLPASSITTLVSY